MFRNQKLIAISTQTNRVVLPSGICNALYTKSTTNGGVEISDSRNADSDTVNVAESFLNKRIMYNIQGNLPKHTQKAIIIASWKILVSKFWRKRLQFFIQGCLDHHPPFQVYLSGSLEKQHRLIPIRSIQDLYNNLYYLQGFDHKKHDASLYAQSLCLDSIFVLDQTTLGNLYREKRDSLLVNNFDNSTLLNLVNISFKKALSLIQNFPEINGINIIKLPTQDIPEWITPNDGNLSLFVQVFQTLIKNTTHTSKPLEIFLKVEQVSEKLLNNLKNIPIQSLVLYDFGQQPNALRRLLENFEHTLTELTLISGDVEMLTEHIPSCLHLEKLTLILCGSGAKIDFLKNFGSLKFLKIYGSFIIEHKEDPIPVLSEIQELVLYNEKDEDGLTNYTDLLSRTKSLKSLEIRYAYTDLTTTFMSIEHLEKVSLIGCGSLLEDYFNAHPHVTVSIKKEPERLNFNPKLCFQDFVHGYLPPKSNNRDPLNQPQNIQPSVPKIDTSTKGKNSNLQQTLYYRGTPEFHDYLIRSNFQHFSIEQRTLISADLSFEKELNIPKNKAPFPTQKLPKYHYHGTFEIPVGKFFTLPTPSANTTILSWWCNDTTIKPQFFENAIPHTYGVFIPYNQTLKEHIVLHIKVTAKLIREWHYPIKNLRNRTDSPLFEALSNLNFKQILEKKDQDDLSIALYKFFEEFTEGSSKDWDVILKENPSLKHLDLSSDEQRMLTILISKKGCCRHIAWGTSALLSYFGFTHTIPGNPTHRFTEILINNQWVTPFQNYTPSSNHETQTTTIDLFQHHEDLRRFEPYIQELRQFLAPTPVSLDQLEDTAKILAYTKSLLAISPNELEAVRHALLRSIKALSPHIQVVYCETEKMLNEWARYALENVCFIINWSRFSIKNRLSNQSILDEPDALLKGNPFFYTNIIGLYEANRVEEIPEDLRSRHQALFKPDITKCTHIAPPLISPLHTIFPINLHQGITDWRALLVGKPVLNTKDFRFNIENGMLHQLVKACPSKQPVLRLINPPNTKEFQLFWDNLVANRCFISPSITPQDEKTIYRPLMLPENFSYQIKTKAVAKKPLSTITKVAFDAFRNAKKTIWVITEKNYSLFLPHSACKPGASTLIESHFLEKITEKDIVCFSSNLHPEIHNLLLDHFPYRHRNTHKYLLPEGFFDIPTPPLTLDDETSKNTFFLSPNIRLSDLLYTYSLGDNYQISSTALPFWRKLRQNITIKFVNLTKDHPLFETFVMAQKTGILLTDSTPLYLQASLEFCEYTEPVDSQTMSLVSTDPDCLIPIENSLNHNPLLKIKGRSDTGKSTLVSRLADKGCIHPYLGWNNFENWILSKEPHATLVLDNISEEEHLDHLLGIRHGYLFFKGKNIKIASDKRIILIQNLSEQPSEKKQKIDNYCTTFILQDVPAEALIKSALDKIPTASNNYKEVFTEILTSFTDFVRAHMPAYPFSFRTVEMIARSSYKKTNSDYWVVSACIQEMHYFFEKHNKKELLLEWPYAQKVNFSLQPQLIERIITTHIKSHLNELQDTSDLFPNGKKMVIIEGKSGIGKSWTIRNTLHHAGFTTTTSDDTKRYVNFSFDSDPNILVKAANRGWIVVFDEMNADSDVLKKAMITLSSCKPHPRFRIFASQNSASSMQGRCILPELVLTQAQCILLPLGSKEDIFNVLSSKFPKLNKGALINWIQVYELVKQSHPEITPRDLINFIAQRYRVS